MRRAAHESKTAARPRPHPQSIGQRRRAAIRRCRAVRHVRRQSAATSSRCRRAVRPQLAGLPRKARSALRITATSMPSCSSAPAAGVNQPSAAITIASSDNAHAHHGALYGDAPRPAGDVHRVGQTVQAVGGQHDVGGFGRRRGAARAHRDTHCGRCQRGSVVDSVADHDCARAIPFGTYGGNFVGRGLLCVNLVESRARSRLRGPARRGRR